MAFINAARVVSLALRAAIALVVALISPLWSAPAVSPTPLEYKVKAAYLFNFAKFIEWPSGAFATPNSPLLIGVMDGGEIFALVQPLLEGKVVDGHPVKVKLIPGEQSEPGLHILFVTHAAERTPEQVRVLVGDTPILLVGETEQFATRGGVIGFVHENDAVRIALNLERAVQVGLKVSAKLSSVARLVKSQRTP